MQTNPTWKDWFVFSRKERTIVVSASVIIVAYLLFIAFYQPKPEAIIIENLDKKIAQLSPQSSDSIAFEKQANSNNTSVSTVGNTLFYFDPNTLDESGFVQLGLSEKTARTIINYRSKGGHFYKPDDLRKIFGLKEEDANRLVPFVMVGSSNKMNGFSEKYTSKKQSEYHKPKPQIIDINTASVGQWQSLPAIGEVLSNRIVKYRDKIGGFSSVADVKKVYGITDSTYNIILPYLSLSAGKAGRQTSEGNITVIQKLNINKATAAELKSNPAIPSDVAEAIVIYRRQHGNYTSVEGIRKIVFISDDMYKKIEPLLSVE